MTSLTLALSLFLTLPAKEAPKMSPVEPDQLFALLAKSDRMVIKESPMKGESVLFQSAKREDLESFAKALVIVKPGPNDEFHCMCMGGPAVYFYKGKQQLLYLTNHHGVSIRTSLWGSDVLLQDQEKWIAWFDAHGISSIRQEVEETRAREKQSRIDEERWDKAMPESVKSGWANALDQFGMVDSKPLAEALAKAVPDTTQRIRSLLEWFGSGAGPWSGYPAYEGGAEDLLMLHPTNAILAAIQSGPLTIAQTEGAARLFGGWTFGKQRPKDREILPKDLKNRLWDHVKSTTDKDKRARAEAAFADGLGN